MPYILFARYMRPGTRHAVLTLEDCLIVGCHFYSRHTFSCTVYALVMQHYFNQLSNAAHPESTLLLLKIAVDLINKACRSRNSGSTTVQGNWIKYSASRKLIMLMICTLGLPSGSRYIEIGHLWVAAAYLDQLQPLSRYERQLELIPGLGGPLRRPVTQVVLIAVDEAWPDDELRDDHANVLALCKRVKEKLGDIDAFRINFQLAEDRLLQLSRACVEARTRTRVEDVPKVTEFTIRDIGISRYDWPLGKAPVDDDYDLDDEEELMSNASEESAGEVDEV